jgi:hypothetical protein
MLKSFDMSFFTGAFVVALALVVAFAARTNPSLPVIGSGRGALIAVALIGMAGCAVGGLSAAPVLGWTHPVIVLGTALGVAALLVIAAGLLGWDGLLRPVVQLAPGNLAAGASTEGLAITALAGLILIKWLIGVGMTLARVVPTPA